DVQVFGDPMGFWGTMPRGMKLRSNKSATNMVEPAGPLSLQAYSADVGVPIAYPVPLSRFVEYGKWVQSSAVPDLETRLVTRVDRERDGFTLELTDGERVAAQRVVVACGIAPFAWTPPGFDHFPSELVSHTGDHTDLAAFAGQRVAVVGG